MEKQRITSILQDKMANWQQELEKQGYIENEADLLTFVRSLDPDEHKEMISDVLTMAGLSRLEKSKQDNLGLTWIHKAYSLNPENERAAVMIEQLEWKKREKLLASLSFPPLRETDHKQAKLQAVEQIQHNCRKFIELADDEKEKLNYFRTKLTNQDQLDLNLKMAELIEAVLEETVLLLKVSEDYKQSVVGVFYHSAYYEEMKNVLDRIESMKAEWERLFFEDSTEIEQASNPLEDLENLIGLEEVKERVKEYYQFLQYQKNRKAFGFQSRDDISLHMVITGNPGTGKSTLARLLAKIYYELGVLTRKEIVEVDRSHLVGAFVGQTEENVRAAVQKALGGVLFIDEAYHLKRNGQTSNDYGQTVIDTLVSLMTSSEYGGKFAVILAGYPEEMRQFLDANPGLRSRFPQSNFIQLPDYTNAELILIAEKLAVDNDYMLTDEAKLELEKRIDIEKVDDTFGNARTVRNLVLDAIFKKGSHSSCEQTIIDYSLLEKNDFELTVKEEIEQPNDRLHQLIGLKNVKNEVKMLMAFVKMQQFRREKGLPTVPIQLHSVFIGNPGTGKTTVAQIYAGLLKQCGFLKRGHLIVASRSDFVAGYVGQTAIKTKKKIREALGGVLFIDEAYSLLSAAQGDFGKEAIDTLVDEMTKHNENLVVILAGYPKEMDLLLQSNPGLQSRFKKFFSFYDYSTDELLQIIMNYASKYEYKLSTEAIEFLKEKLSLMDVSGNGRFATNLTDETIQFQAMRIIDDEKIDVQHEVNLLEKEDFETALKRMGKGD